MTENVIDFTQAQQKIKNLKVEDFKKKQPYLSEYLDGRKESVLVIDTLEKFIKEFENSILCFSDEREIAMQTIETYLLFKIIVTNMHCMLKETDEEVKLHFPSFDPNKI